MGIIATHEKHVRQKGLEASGAKKRAQGVADVGVDEHRAALDLGRDHGFA